MKRAFAHEDASLMKQPSAMKCGFATIKVSALRFIAALPLLHRSRRLLLHIANGRCFIDTPFLYFNKTEKGGLAMRNDKLSVQSMDFAVQIIHLVKSLKEKRESIISNQIGRSGTSIGANIREAQYAHGKADFIARLQIALKEANETGYWLELLSKTNYITEEEYKALDSACTSIRVMLVSSINTAKNGSKTQ